MNICDVCKQPKREAVTQLKTYNQSYVYSCEQCKAEMARTLQIMKLSADSICDKFETCMERLNNFIVSPLN